MIEVASVELNNIISDDQQNNEINQAWRPLREGMEFARPFFIVILVQAFERIVELAADFSSGVKIGEQFGEFRAIGYSFGRCLPGDHLRFPRGNRASQGRRTAGRRRQIPRVNDVHARADECFERRRQP